MPPALELWEPRSVDGFEGSMTMTREEAFAKCPADSYVEFYGNRWLIVPFAPVTQPSFFACSPTLEYHVHG